MAKKDQCGQSYKSPFGWVYFLTVIGATIYFISQTQGFWLIILAILKAFVWPVFVILKVLELLGI